MTSVIFFSRKGKNKQNGENQYINVGNTEIVAQKIAQQLKCESCEIRPVNPYSSDYEVTKIRSYQEFLNDTEVEILAMPDFERDDSIVLGFPNWWNTMPQPVKTFLNTCNLDGKRIYPFVTHEGSQFGQSLDVIQQSIPAIELMRGLPIRGSRAFKSDCSIVNWLENLDIK